MKTIRVLSLSTSPSLSLLLLLTSTVQVVTMIILLQRMILITTTTQMLWSSSRTVSTTGSTTTFIPSCRGCCFVNAFGTIQSKTVATNHQRKIAKRSIAMSFIGKNTAKMLHEPKMLHHRPYTYHYFPTPTTTNSRITMQYSTQNDNNDDDNNNNKNDNNNIEENNENSNRNNETMFSSSSSSSSSQPKTSIRPIATTTTTMTLSTSTLELPCGGVPFPNITDSANLLSSRGYQRSMSSSSSSPSSLLPSPTNNSISLSSSSSIASFSSSSTTTTTNERDNSTTSSIRNNGSEGKSFDANSVLAIDPSIIRIKTIIPTENDTNDLISNNNSNEQINGEKNTITNNNNNDNINRYKKQEMDLFLRQLPFVEMFRGSANYIANHRNTIAVYHIPGGLVDTDSNSNNNGNTVFRDLMNDIALTWLLGMKIVIVAGCRYQIQKRLMALSSQTATATATTTTDDDNKKNGLNVVLNHGLRVTDENTLRIVKEEAGYVRFEVERQLARSLRIQGSTSTTPSFTLSTSVSNNNNNNSNNSNTIGNGDGGAVRSTAAAAAVATTASTGSNTIFEGNVVSGNFYSAQPFGILDGIDYKYTGFVRRVEIEKIKRLHNEVSRDICLLTSLGVSPSGEVFNVNSESLAAIVAGSLGASKVIYFTENEIELRHKIHHNRIHSLRYNDAKNLLKYYNIQINSKGYVTIMDNDNENDNESDNQSNKMKSKKSKKKKKDNTDEDTTSLTPSSIVEYNNNNNTISLSEEDDLHNQYDMLLKIGWCTEAIKLGVKRAHIISPKHGALLQELYTRDGSGTLISADLYEGIRRADYMDVAGIHELILPLIQMGTLINRPKSILEKEIHTYYVYTRDNSIVACGQLKKFEDNFAEIGCLVVNKDFRARGRGDAMLGYLERLCLLNNCNKIFVLSTQTMEWFIERGFKPGTVDQLPPSRQATYNYKRASKIYIKIIENDRDLDASELWWNR